MIESGASPKRVKAASGYPFIFAGGKSWLEGLSVDLENLQALLPRPVPSAPSVPRRETSGLAKGDQNSAGQFFFERIQRSRRFRWVTVVFIHVYIYIFISSSKRPIYIYTYAHLCVWINIYIHISIYIYIFICIVGHIYTKVHQWIEHVFTGFMLSRRESFYIRWPIDQPSFYPEENSEIGFGSIFFGGMGSFYKIPWWNV